MDDNPRMESDDAEVEGVEIKAGDQVTLRLSAQVIHEAWLKAYFPAVMAQYAELEGLSPHLFPIVVGALVDAKVTELIATMLVECEDTAKLLDAMEYVAKVRLAVALGIVPPELGKAARTIGHIRNHFAHSPKASLVDPKVNKPLITLIDDVMRIVLKDDFPDDPQGMGVAIKSTKVGFESEDEAARSLALRESWMLLSVYFEGIATKIEGLKPLLPDGL